jgi:hypothetical protein
VLHDVNHHDLDTDHLTSCPLSTSTPPGGNGSGLLENVIEAYNFIVNNFTPGDQLFFFGFSRGAFTARSTAGLVNEIGILRPSSMRKFIQMYSAFVDKGVFEPTFGATAEWSNFIKTRPDPVVVGREKQEIEVIGVWDTVGALGVPDMGHIWRRDHSDTRKPFEFHDVKLNSRMYRRLVFVCTLSGSCRLTTRLFTVYLSRRC